MKKTTKGAIAAGSAALLLAGGAGTMAAWNASTTGGDPTTVTAGSLSVAQVGTGVWTLNGQPFAPATEKIVPGDVVKYTADYNINLVGTNLKATLQPTLGGVGGDLFTSGAISVDAAAGTATQYTEGAQTVTYVTQINFLPGAVGDNTSQNKTASLAGSSVTLEQTIGG